jgi:glycerophosphoryl diester phosphodiesterase
MTSKRKQDDSVEPNIKRRKVLGTLLAGGLVQGCGGGAAPSVLSPVIQPDVQPVEVLPSLSSLAGKPIYIAHRGSGALYPEETYLAYDESVRNGETLLECDVQMLRGGSLGLMHDSTVDRTTSASGEVASLTESEWRALRVNADTWHGSRYGNDLSVPLFSEWVQKYRSKAIFVPEDKDRRSMAAMLIVFDALKVGGNQVLFQSFSLAPLQLAMKAGYQTCFLATATASSTDVVAAGVGWVGLPLGTSQADLKKWIASGLKILLWTVNRRFQREEGLGLGLTGFFSDDPVYLRETRPLSTVDQFSDRKWSPGMLGNGNDTSLALRGEFFSDGYWGYSSVQAGYLGCLHGYLCPIRSVSQPRIFDLDLKITFDSALANDATRWASVFIGSDDRPFFDSNEFSAGYNILFRKNGTIEIYKKALGAKAVVLVTSHGNEIADGEEVGYRVNLTEAAISVVRLNRDGSSSHVATSPDSTFHCVYLSLGRNGLACRFRQISIK